MHSRIDRRDFLKLAGIGGVVFASSLAGYAGRARAGGADDFYFVQLSDSHWGFEGPPNPDAKGTLRKAVAAVNALAEPPDFIVFTGDLTHITEDARERRRRLAEFKDIVAELNVKDVRFMPGEHDASLDQGKAFREFFGATNYTFDHKGVHFVVVDNVSDPARIHRGRAAQVARRRSREAAEGRQHRRLHPPAALRSLSAVGLGDPRRRQGDRGLDAASRTSRCSTGTSTRSITR